MDGVRRTGGSALAQPQQRPSTALLVRCWLEPGSGAEPVLRGYVKDLRSGSEVPIADFRAVEEHLRRQLGLTEHAARQQADEASA